MSNTIDLLKSMDIWKSNDIEISGNVVDQCNVIIFKKGNIIVMVPEIELLIIGAHKIFEMFKGILK